MSMPATRPRSARLRHVHDGRCGRRTRRSGRPACRPSSRPCRAARRSRRGRTGRRERRSPAPRSRRARSCPPSGGTRHGCPARTRAARRRSGRGCRRATRADGRALADAVGVTGCRRCASSRCRIVTRPSRGWVAANSGMYRTTGSLDVERAPFPLLRDGDRGDAPSSSRTTSSSSRWSSRHRRARARPRRSATTSPTCDDWTAAPRCACRPRCPLRAPRARACELPHDSPRLRGVSVESGFTRARGRSADESLRSTMATTTTPAAGAGSTPPGARPGSRRSARGRPGPLSSASTAARSARSG